MVEKDPIDISGLCNKFTKHKWDIINKRKVFKLSDHGKDLGIALVNLKDYLNLLEALELYQGIYQGQKDINEGRTMTHKHVENILSKKYKMK